MSHIGMAVSNYKADDKEAGRNKKRLLAIIKQPGNNVCADCPNKREALPPPSRSCMPRRTAHEHPSPPRRPS